MKMLITKITFDKEIETKFGKMFRFRADYDGKIGFFLAKIMEQKTFIQGEENEFTETAHEYQGSTYYRLKSLKQYGTSNFSRQVKKEQSKYSGFAMSYAKDLVVAGMIPQDEIFVEAKNMMDWMVSQDKALEDGK